MQNVSLQFHRSIYITLGLACACLGYAELPFLQTMPYVAGAVILLLIVAYFVEGKWSLSIPAANVLGGVIAAATIALLAQEFFGADDSLIATLPWPTSLLPYLGPLLMILVPAKSFRPKHNGDYWGLHGIGLIAVALGCALTGDPVFGILMLAYVVSAIWSLLLFYYFRELQNSGDSTRPGILRPRRSLARATSWAAVTLLLAMALFLVTPRTTEARWEFHTAAARLQSGLDENRPTIDLNRSGIMSVNRDRVFTARAYIVDRDGARIAKTDLEPGQRWRHMPFNSYENGKWDNRPFIEPQSRSSAPMQRRFAEQVTILPPIQPAPALPDIRQPHFFIDFSTQNRGSARQIKAEPIWLVEDGEIIPSIATRLDGGQAFRWSRSVDGELTPPAWSYASQQTDYVQRVALGGPRGVSPLLPISEANLEHHRACSAVPRLRAWTQALLNRFVAQGRLPKEVLGADDRAIRVPPQYYEAVGRELEKYLSTSGEFRYTLTLTREDPSIDPVEDFVLNLRKGHCSRFASALALMLRSVGIPARVVLGYRGFESEGDGTYEVQQCHAHSWVEMAFRYADDEANLPWMRWLKEGTKWRWLTLDPTPMTEDVQASDFSWQQWWSSTQSGLAEFFKSFIVEYDQTQQDRTRIALLFGDWSAIPAILSRWLLGEDGNDWMRACLIGLAFLALGLLVAKLVRMWRSPRASSEHSTVPFYQRMLEICAGTLKMAPRVGQTPVEFATAAGLALRADSSTSGLADLPSKITALYYRVRFGNRPLEAREQSEIDADLNRLAAMTPRSTQGR